MDPQPAPSGDTSVILHASAVALGGRGLLIRGGSGSGKSGLALRMMALGAALVADDRVILTRQTGGIALRPPDPIRGLIEARGLGLLRADVASHATLAAILDLDTPETERLPPERGVRILGLTVPLLHNVAAGYFPAALVQYLRAGKSA